MTRQHGQSAYKKFLVVVVTLGTIVLSGCQKNQEVVPIEGKSLICKHYIANLFGRSVSQVSVSLLSKDSAGEFFEASYRRKGGSTKWKYVCHTNHNSNDVVWAGLFDQNTDHDREYRRINGTELGRWRYEDTGTYSVVNKDGRIRATIKIPSHNPVSFFLSKKTKTATTNKQKTPSLCKDEGTKANLVTTLGSLDKLYVKPFYEKALDKNIKVNFEQIDELVTDPNGDIQCLLTSSIVDVVENKEINKLKNIVTITKKDKGSYELFNDVTIGNFFNYSLLEPIINKQSKNSLEQVNLIKGVLLEQQIYCSSKLSLWRQSTQDENESFSLVKGCQRSTVEELVHLQDGSFYPVPELKAERLADSKTIFFNPKSFQILK